MRTTGRISCSDKWLHCCHGLVAGAGGNSKPPGGGRSRLAGSTGSLRLACRKQRPAGGARLTRNLRRLQSHHHNPTSAAAVESLLQVVPARGLAGGQGSLLPSFAQLALLLVSAQRLLVMAGGGGGVRGYPRLQKRLARSAAACRAEGGLPRRRRPACPGTAPTAAGSRPQVGASTRLNRVAKSLYSRAGCSNMQL